MFSGVTISIRESSCSSGLGTPLLFVAPRAPAMGKHAAAGLSSSEAPDSNRGLHCWTSQQWHPLRSLDFRLGLRQPAHGVFHDPQILFLPIDWIGFVSRA